MIGRLDGKHCNADRKARIAGFLYLICIVSGFCAEALVRNKLVAYDDATFTARSILATPGRGREHCKMACGADCSRRGW
jgi:hypothetical protein